MRSIWKGHIRFLLVAIPVRIYNAIETSEKIQFNQLHREDFGPIGYDKRCKKCDQIVTNDQITKGYQYETDRWAIVEPDDIARIKIKTTKAVDIVGFVGREEIPSTFYDSPYFAGPDGPVSEKPYALLREVMKQTGKIVRTWLLCFRMTKVWCCRSCTTHTSCARWRMYPTSRTFKNSTRKN
jgi:DNA end-binding protein Ku